MEKKNVLIISDNFLKGGLERHILNQYNGLKNKINFVFLFSNYIEHDDFKDSKIYHYEVERDITVNKFLLAIDKIVEIVVKEKIDIIHVHPFNSIFPAFIASQITKKPIVYTVHGFASLSFINFYNGVNNDILFKIYLNNCNPAIITVNNDHYNVLQNKYLAKNINYIPNSINTSLFKNIKLEKNNKWLLISRLDKDKMEVEEVLKILNKLDISLDIIGDGEKREYLENLTKELKLEDKVTFKGFKDDIPKEINKGYNGIIGVGQVVLEGLCSNLPVLLIGYKKITGLIDKKLLDDIKDRNFINCNLANEFDINEFEHVNDNLKKYQLRDEIVKNYDVKITNEKYYNILMNTKFWQFDSLVKIYNDLKKACSENEMLANEQISNSKNVFYILKENLSLQVTDPEIINIFKTYDSLFTIQNLKNDIDKVEYKVDNIGLREVSKRTIRNFKKTFSKDK